jgi:acyl carrier protein
LLESALLRIIPDADVGSISADDDLRETLELDSLDFLSLVEMLSQNAGVRLDEDDYPRLSTVRSTVDLLTSRS